MAISKTLASDCAPMNVRFSNRPFRVKRFQTSIATVWMSLTGSCFSSESAPGPSIMGFENEVEQSFGRPCRQTDRRVQRTLRSHLIHRPARDIMPPHGGTRVSPI